MNNKGFTLVELLAVIVILAALALITTTSVAKILKDSKEDLYNTQFSALESMVGIWMSDNMDLLPDVDNCAYITLKDLKPLGVVIKRAKYFITCNGNYFTNPTFFKASFIKENLLLEDKITSQPKKEQLSLFS